MLEGPAEFRRSAWDDGGKLRYGDLVKDMFMPAKYRCRCVGTVISDGSYMHGNSERVKVLWPGMSYGYSVRWLARVGVCE